MQTEAPLRVGSQTMFFPRLRRQAKWVFVFLALVFALGFVVFGVGSGNFGLGDIFNNNGGGTKSAESQARSEIKKNPNNVQGWQDLAQALSAKGDVKGEIDAYRHALKLRPKDPEVLGSLAAVYQQRANQLQPQINSAQSSGSQTLSAFNSGITLKGQLVVPPNPIFSAISTAQSSRLNDLFSRQQSDYGTAEQIYLKIVKLQPKDAPAQLNLGQAAQQAGDTKSAINAYKRFIALAPDDPTVPVVKQQITALKQSGGVSPTVQAGG